MAKDHEITRVCLKMGNSSRPFPSSISQFLPPLVEIAYTEIMPSVLTAKPVNAQVRFRCFFVPPRYEFFKVEVSTALATRFAETYGLKSTDIIVNQNAASSQYLSLRYILKGEPFRYMDVSVGLDQGEVYFSNPATIPELMTEVGRVWSIFLEMLTPTVQSSYFEATLHCETEKPGAKAFLNEMVRLTSDESELRKGFSIVTQLGGVNKLTLEVSDSVQDGLYVVFASISNVVLRDTPAFSKAFESTLATYRKLQNIASVQILERNIDGSFATRN
ncbi:MAG: hypothetical protein WD688_11695 [Candidatus Binatia bacterium]